MIESRRYVKLQRNQGAWIANIQWDDGERDQIPCVHKHFLRGDRYLDPRVNWQRSAKYQPYAELMRSKRMVAVIDSEFDPTIDNPDDWKFESRGYIGVFEIDLSTLSPDNAPLSFRVIKRYKKRG
jgi:hypothetical protein